MRCILYIVRRTQLYLDEDLWKILRTRSRQDKTTVSDLVRRAVRERERQRDLIAAGGGEGGLELAEVDADEDADEDDRRKEDDRQAEADANPVQQRPARGDRALPTRQAFGPRRRRRVIVTAFLRRALIGLLGHTPDVPLARDGL